MAPAPALRPWEEGGQQLRNVVVSTVKPSERTAHPEKHDVALLDMLLPDNYMPILMFYRPGREDGNRLSSSQFVTRMKHSLARVLVKYYPFAGRGVKTYDPRIRTLMCNDEGVPFIEAEIDEEMEKVVNIDDFKPLSILCGYELIGLDAHLFYQVNADFPLPGCFIQVTKFKCGGISVNVSFLHMVADGKAMFQFLKDWSQMTLSQDAQISLEPIHDRSLTHPLSVLLNMLAGVGPPSEPNGSVNGANHEALPVDHENTVNGAQDQTDELNTSLQKNILDDSAPVPSSKKSTAEDCKEHTKSTTDGNAPTAVSGGVDMAPAFFYPLMPEWTCKTLHVRREIVQKLKDKAKDRKDGFVPTALDCIQSNIWRAICRVPSSIGGRKSSMYGMFIEGRQRLHDPPLPDSYSGNALLVDYTPPLHEPSSDPLVEAAMIHKMVRSVTPQSWLPVLGRAISIAKNIQTSDERVYSSSSWYRFPVYEPDFGYGKPVYAACNHLGAPPPAGYAMILPPRPGSDYLASIQFYLAPEMLQVLLKDSEFRSFFH